MTMKASLTILLFALLVIVMVYVSLTIINQRSVSHVSFDHVVFNDYCYPFAQIATFEHFPDSQKIDTQFVINNDDEYQTLLQYRKAQDQACAQISLPTIDFSKNTLLGQYTSGNCGTTDFKRFLYRHNKQKTYIFLVERVDTIRKCSGPAGKSMNWIVTPKIPDDYEVLFRYDT